MPKKFTSKTQKIGEVGEKIACNFLTQNGFDIIERNVTRRYSEIDILAEKEGIVHCIEVKTSRAGSSIRPEENITAAKLKKIQRGVGQLLQDSTYTGRVIQVDLVAVILDSVQKEASVTYFPKIM